MEFLRRRRGGAERRNLGALPKWPVPGDSYALETRPLCVRSFRRICDSPARLPSVFSESIVIMAAPRLFGSDWKATFGGKECDVLIGNVSGETKRIEVKTTAEHAFQEFKSKDLRADILVWIRFGRRFQEGQGRIEIALLREPSRFIAVACRLDTVRFERRVGSTDHLRVLAFDSLEALLGSIPAPRS